MLPRPIMDGAWLADAVATEPRLGPGRLFPGSWWQWSADPSRPMAVGR